jgi:hypothetical protein
MTVAWRRPSHVGSMMVHARSIPGDRGDLTRIVDHVTILGEPVDFRALCERAVPPETRYLVLDLDRTLHLGRNMGELLGWEICAYLAYGQAYLDELEPVRATGRVFLEPRRVLGTLNYLRYAADHWVPPGLHYLVWGKSAARSTWLRRMSYLRYGREPVRAVQSIPQHALMHRLAGLPVDLSRELALRVWRRYRDDQTIEREDLDWLRRRCPGVRIVISSASPRPTLEVGAAALGVDAIVYSEQEEHAGRFSAPCDLRPLCRPEARPHRISPPALDRINAGRGKLEALFARFPELREPGVVSVGISDTGYGEDHAWSEAFTRLVDVNSETPFPPVVPRDARVRHIVSAGLLTWRERQARERGEPWLDPRRPPVTTGARELDQRTLIAALATTTPVIERLAHDIEAETERLRPLLEADDREVDRAQDVVERAVEAFNTADEANRMSARRRLAGALRDRQRAEARRTRTLRPVSSLTFSLTRELEHSRARLDARA